MFQRLTDRVILRDRMYLSQGMDIVVDLCVLLICSQIKIWRDWNA